MKTLIRTALSNFLSSKRTLAFFLSGLLLITSTNIFGQNRWNTALRAGANFPTTKLGNADLQTGFGFGGTIGYRVLPHLNVNAGWDWNHFSANQSFAGSNMDFEETGYNLGLQFIHPIERSKIHYVIGAGGIYNHIEIENGKGELVSNSGHGFGWQVEAGLSFPIAKRLDLMPGVRYRSLSREFKTADIGTSVDLNYISAGVAFSWYF
jgi:opacity protein-like surface antigen